MSSATSLRQRNERDARSAQTDPAWVRRCLIAGALLFLGLLLVVPLLSVFTEALRKGIGPALESFTSSDARHAILLTLLVAVISVPLNIVFGVAAAWAITKHEFRGKSLLITLIDLPFSVSPVISGLIYVLLFGAKAGSGRG
jgi:sulfate transport system permease protein